MAEVYIVYSSEDRLIAKVIADLLSRHWEVWWDDSLVGNFSQVIQSEMSRTKFVVAILSKDAVKKDTVIDEMRLAKEAGVALLPLMLDLVSPPYPYGGLSRVSLNGWDETEAHPSFQQILRKISSVVPRQVPPTRPLNAFGTSLSLPAVFLSVSSHETQLEPLEAIRALRAFGCPSILISAYDLWKARRPETVVSELDSIREAGGVVLVDSGNYEASRRRDKTWTPKKFYEALEGIPSDWAYCFDVMTPPECPKVATSKIVAAVRRDARATGKIIFPIVHTHRNDAGYNTSQLPEVVKSVAGELQPSLIAVAERELGCGLIERAHTMRKIRQSLNELPFYQAVHVLGTGNPWSISLLAAAGADSFDGLEWCRMAIDHQMHRLNHYQHFDFFTFQTELSESKIALEALGDDKIGYAGKVAFHNLEYYRSFTTNLHRYAQTNHMETLVLRVMGDGATNQVAKALPGIFGP